MPKLLSVGEMPKVSGIKMPWDLYIVFNEPSLLAGMSYPRPITPWKNLEKAGFTGVVCLCDVQPDYDPAPLRLLYSTELEDLCSGGLPVNQAREEKLVRDAVKAVITGLDDGEGIIVHCVGGIGRTGTVIGCVLRELGLSAAMAIDYLDQVNLERCVGEWSESKWQAEMVRKYLPDRI
jgi:protein-tyrosine phosphatase